MIKQARQFGKSQAMHIVKEAALDAEKRILVVTANSPNLLIDCRCGQQIGGTALRDEPIVFICSNCGCRWGEETHPIMTATEVIYRGKEYFEGYKGPF